MSKPKEFWDKSADNYDRTEERFEHIHQTSRECAKRHLKESDVVLDYGCGTGTTACELASHVREIQGIDIAGRMIELSKEKAAANGIGNVSFAQADIFDEGYSKGSFDVILAFNMLHTVPDPQRVVRRAHELLKPEGSFISVTPCLRDKMSLIVSAQIQLVRLLCRLGIIPVPIRRLQNSDLDELVSGGDFQAAETQKIFSGASSYFIAAKKNAN
ncbi:class I SAM-dependent methyltransferase [Sneathiella marina]|uniref:Class I SAM-dependent methyltransferase n=1 Tax=Sneathiella marina TaxID=2950108 RepID=A0ABY4VYU1_9PROT|nr:class I SAM-dependent methyltransferase [Sneathiella marina]USG60088.1 class I SAM-dependent methyltransferase [Sneathiella marina]